MATDVILFSCIVGGESVLIHNITDQDVEKMTPDEYEVSESCIMRRIFS